MFIKLHIKLFKYILIIIGLFNSISYSQSLSNKDYLINDVQYLVNSNPKRALTISNYLLNMSAVTVKEKAEIEFLMAKAYKNEGSYSKALTILYDENKYRKDLSEKEIIDIDFEKIAILNELSLDEESEKILAKLADRSMEEEDANLKKYLQFLISIERAKGFFKNNEVDKGIKTLENIAESSNDIVVKFPILKIKYELILGELFLQKHDLVESGRRFEKVLSLLNVQKHDNLYDKTFALSGMAMIRYYQKRNIEVIPILNEAFVCSKKLSNAFLQLKIVSLQNDNFLALNDIGNYKLTNQWLMKNSYKCDVVEQEAINTGFNLISKENSELHNEWQNSHYKIVWSLCLIEVIIILIFIFLWSRLSEEEGKINEIIKYVEITKKEFSAVPPIKISSLVKKEDSKKYLILKETEDEILKKLKRFENSKRFLSKDISLAVLAGQLDTNIKYLSEIINSHYNVNFNTYINNLKINHIVEKLKKDPNFMNYKISYLAEYCGFSTHSSFATVFKSTTGISPMKFIDLLSKEKENTLLENDYK